MGNHYAPPENPFRSLSASAIDALLRPEIIHAQICRRLTAAMLRPAQTSILRRTIYSMPFSHNALDPIVAEILKCACPQLLLDIGAGAGKYGAMMKALEADTGLTCRKIGIEINSGYVDQFNLHSNYDELWVQNAVDLVLSRPDLTGDIVVWGDCIEHLPKSQGVDLLEYLLYRFRQVVVIFPIDLPQGAWDGHVKEAHISLWYPEDFQRYKASTCISRTQEGYTMCLALMNGVFVPPAERISLKISGNSIDVVEGNDGG